MKHVSGRDEDATHSRHTENTHPTNWKTKHHTYKHRLRQVYAKEDGSALALVNTEECERIQCKWVGKRKFVVNGKPHKLVYLTRDLRRRFLKKRLYTRVITDSGSELLARDKRGHWRRVRAY